VLAMVSASLFRRAFRLYLPVLIITLMTTTYIYFGYYEYNRPFLMNHERYFPGDWNEEKPPRFPTYYAQLQFWSREMFDLTNLIWERTVYPWHDQHLWSILSEMRASLHLYVCLLMLAQCTRPIRLVFFALIAVLYFWWDHWEIWVYIGGAMVAQIDIILIEAEQKEATRLPSSSVEDFELNCIPSTWRSVCQSSTLRLPCRFSIRNTRPYMRYLGFFIAFYFLSYPINGPHEYAPGYMTLNRLIPEWMVRKDKFYSNIGTILLLFLLVRSPEHSKWRRFLNSKIPQYMGSIGFSFYLIHGPMMHAFGYMVPQYFWRTVVGSEGPNDVTNLEWIAAILCGWVLTLVASLWAADIWAREVEGRCGQVTKVLETYCFRVKT
jgi:peptidoglycan/LPS O-acetylase OafA/YrhL